MRIGISDSTLWIMYCLCDSKDDCTQNSIAEDMGVPKQTINSAINNLVKKGYVYLEKMSVSGNSKTVCLTDKGKEFCERFIIPIMNAKKEAFMKLPQSEQEAFLMISMKQESFLQESLHELLDKIEEQ